MYFKHNVSEAFSCPITCFEVDFSKAHNDGTEDNGTYTSSVFVVPVVFDVSVQRYCKLIKLYSTVSTESDFCFSF